MINLRANLFSGNTSVDSSPQDESVRRRVCPPACKPWSKVPSTHYGFDIVWRSFAAVAAIGLTFFVAAPFRFRRTVAVS
jgi:cytochrome oxidase assembly protein ShyY1